MIAQGDYENAFTDLLDELISGHGGRSLQERRRAVLTMLSCKNAIKAGDPLQSEQVKGLLDDLLQLPNPGICPHGQPILIKISTLELDKKFEREYARAVEARYTHTQNESKRGDSWLPKRVLDTVRVSGLTKSCCNATSPLIANVEKNCGTGNYTK
jgi:hypothetical protein